MISDVRVGVPAIGGRSWLGGVSFIELHVKAVTALPANERPRLFLVVSGEAAANLEFYQPFITLFDGVILIGDTAADIPLPTGTPCIRCDSEDELFQKIDFYFPVSFNVLSGRCAASWIHDFQHRHLPEFFSQQDITRRDMLCRLIADQARLVFCTSRAVENDFKRFFPQSRATTWALPLKVSPEESWYNGEPTAIQAKYALPEHFILCCNQFWAHKNHWRLFAAVALLRKAGRDVHLVCTGATADYRHPDYLQKLKDYIDELGIRDLVHILGLIPREHQIQLLRRSLFVVQPSLFEGLSLIVQECRALGKAIILSDLDVHLEHEYGIYFERQRPKDLAAKIAGLLPVTIPGPDLRREAEARIQANSLCRLYAQKFCALVEEAREIFATPDTGSPAIALSNPREVVIATSLTPHDAIEKQKQAMDSWRKLGFKIISLNTPAEQRLLAPLFAGITFCELRRTVADREISGAYLDEIFSFITRNGSEVCGIIANDTCLDTTTDLKDLILREAPKSLVYGESLMKTAQSKESLHLAKLGYFFFGRELARTFPREEFVLGLPWWDIWTGLIPLFAKIPLKKIANLPAFYLAEENPPGSETWLAFGKIVARYLSPSFPLTEDTVARYRHLAWTVLDSNSIRLSV